MVVSASFKKKLLNPINNNGWSNIRLRFLSQFTAADAVDFAVADDNDDVKLYYISWLEESTMMRDINMQACLHHTCMYLPYT